MRFQRRERGTDVSEQQLAGELDGDLRVVAADTGDQRHLHDFECLAFFERPVFHRRGDGANETVGHENTEERADERRADLLTDFRRLRTFE